ncbi:MAG: hypothetical protein Q9223_005894 [Gallowayella weberi]
MASQDEPVFQPKDAISEALQGTMILGSAGLFLSAVQNTLTRQPNNPVSRDKISDWKTAAVGGTYELARTAAANLREKNDHWNPAIGGFFGGGIDADSPAVRSFPAVLGFGALLAVIQGVFDFTGGKLSGFARDNTVDEYERIEQMRRNKRRPIEETLQELGEGRGIKGPGYEERRRERLKQRYGIDLPQTA